MLCCEFVITRVQCNDDERPGHVWFRRFPNSKALPTVWAKSDWTVIMRATSRHRVPIVLSAFAGCALQAYASHWNGLACRSFLAICLAFGSRYLLSGRLGLLFCNVGIFDIVCLCHPGGSLTGHIRLRTRWHSAGIALKCLQLLGAGLAGVAIATACRSQKKKADTERAYQSGP